MIKKESKKKRVIQEIKDSEEYEKKVQQDSQEWESYSKKIEDFYKYYLVNKEKNTTCFESVEVDEEGYLKIEKYESNLKFGNCQKCQMSLIEWHWIDQRLTIEFEIKKFEKYFGEGNLKNLYNYLIDEN